MSIKELVNFGRIERKPVIIREKEIQLIKTILSERLELFEEVNFSGGMKV